MSTKPQCKYGPQCYRQNPQHRAQYSHGEETNTSTTQQKPSTKTTTTISAPTTNNTVKIKPATSQTRTAVTTPLTEKHITKKKKSSSSENEAKSAINLNITESSTFQTQQPKKKRKVDQKDEEEKERHLSIDLYRKDVDQSDEEEESDIEWRSFIDLCDSAVSWETRHSYYHSLFNSLFHLSFPDDFYQFFQFLLIHHHNRDDCHSCSSTASFYSASCVKAALILLPCSSDGQYAGIEMCGLYDYFSDSLDDLNKKKFKPWLHQRYFYDLPELMTISRLTYLENQKISSKSQEKQLEEPHSGYWRDAPEDLPVFIVSCSDIDPKCSVQGRTVYHAMHQTLLQLLKMVQVAATSSISSSSSSSSSSRSKYAQSIRTTIAALISDASSHSYVLTNRSGDAVSPLRDSHYLARQKLVLSTSFNGLGFICPYDRTTQVGFRDLPVSDEALLSLCQRMEIQRRSNVPVDWSEWDGIMNLIALANDEMDPGTCLLLAQDVYCVPSTGKGCRVLDNQVVNNMTLAYELQGNREPWIKAIRQQMKYRYRQTKSQIALAQKEENKEHGSSSTTGESSNDNDSKEDMDDEVVEVQKS